ncbi:MAG: adenylate kinase family protein [Mycoplasma sp.]
MIKNKKIILLGAPGSGKGTLSYKLIEAGFYHISTGDLFRNKLKEDSEESREIQLLLNRGELIPDSITNKLAKDEIIKSINDNKSFILDGYPRTIDQAKYLDTICEMDYVFYLDVAESVLFKRITGRVTCKQCNKIYNTYFAPPKEDEICDDCKIPLVRRRDDNERSFQFRMNEYNEKTKPLINYYENNKKLVKINSDDSMESILNKVLEYLND